LKRGVIFSDYIIPLKWQESNEAGRLEENEDMMYY